MDHVQHVMEQILTTAFHAVEIIFCTLQRVLACSLAQRVTSNLTGQEVVNNAFKQLQVLLIMKGLVRLVLQHYQINVLVVFLEST